MNTEVATLESTPQAGASMFMRWYVLIVMCLVYTVSIADRYVISTVMEPIRLELHLTDSGVAFLTGTVLSFFYVTFGIPLSLLADRVNRRNLIAISIVAWSAMTVLCGRAATYWQLLWPRIGVAIGEAGGTPSATSILADYFPPLRRPMALTIFSLGAPIGAWVGPTSPEGLRMPTVGGLYFWRWAFRASCSVPSCFSPSASPKEASWMNAPARKSPL